MGNIPPSLYLVILKKLAKRGLRINCDISPLLFKYFTNDDFTEFYWNQKEEKIVSFLNYIKSANHIEYKIEQYELPNRPHNEIRILAHVTPDGFTYYQKHRYTIYPMLIQELPGYIKLMALLGTIILAILGMVEFFNKPSHKPLEIKPPNKTEKPLSPKYKKTAKVNPKACSSDSFDR